MRLLLFGQNSSVTRTLKTMLDSVESWSITKESSLGGANKPTSDPKKFDLLIANLEDFDQPAINVVSNIKQNYPNAPLLVIHSYLNKALITPLIAAGATGYINNDLTEDILLEAVQKVKTGSEFIVADST